MKSDDPLAREINALLDDGAHQGHPLHAALAELYTRYLDQSRQIDRISHIADRYQNAERERGQGYAVNYQRKLRQLEKIVRISDQYQHMLRDVNDRLQWLSSRDELTGLPNRRFMLGLLGDHLRKLAKGGEPVCVAMADIDHFKSINDNYGHDAGDKVLAALGELFRNNLRADDVCGRWGGEEFLIILPGADLESSTITLARLRARVSALPGPDDGDAFRLSLSIGLVRGDDPDEAPDHLLKRVDEALYAAKRQGRDRTVIA
ncbi:GGDEF domain-containing protein [Pigmentiphaga aceris]|uniref:diguanylate cyclase n=2 Tax=Pigmentiphaga aceris TaxID=1940612 RepID=A0A5C0B5K0_9BURK|nr:GGDEF domain-containing protein [Pigmentiphaga aceris]